MSTRTRSNLPLSTARIRSVGFRLSDGPPGAGAFTSCTDFNASLSFAASPSKIAVAALCIAESVKYIAAICSAIVLLCHIAANTAAAIKPPAIRMKLALRKTFSNDRLVFALLLFQSINRALNCVPLQRPCRNRHICLNRRHSKVPNYLHRNLIRRRCRQWILLSNRSLDEWKFINLPCSLICYLHIGKVFCCAQRVSGYMVVLYETGSFAQIAAKRGHGLRCNTCRIEGCSLKTIDHA